MANLADLVVSITAQTKQFDKAISDTKKKTEGVEKGIKKTTQAIKGLVAGVAVAALVQKIGQIATASIDAASVATETRTKFNTAFKGIESDADAVAKNLQDNYGLARTESENLLSGTADLVKGFGANATQALDTSDTIQKLSVDLADYNTLQGGASRASEILTKAYLGERDSLVSLGIKISENDVKQRLLEKGQEKLTGQALLLAKGNATLELAMQQSGDAIGSFARSAGSYEQAAIKAKAASSDLQVEIGRAMLPAATVATEAFGKLTEAVADFIRESNNLKEAEKAVEEGTAQADQRLIVLKDETEELQLQLKIKQSSFKDLQRTQVLSKADVKIFKEQISLLEGQISAKQRQISGIKIQQKEQQELNDKLAEEKAEAEAVEKANKKKYEAAEKAVKDQDLLIQDVINNSKSEIDLIDEKIDAITKTKLVEGKYRDDQIKALEALTSKKKEILEKEEADKQKIINDAQKNRQDQNAQTEADGAALAQKAKGLLGDVFNVFDSLAKESYGEAIAGAGDLIAEVGQMTGNAYVMIAGIIISTAGSIVNAFEEAEDQVEGITEDLVKKTTAIQLKNEKEWLDRKFKLRKEAISKEEQEAIDAYVNTLTAREQASLKSAGIITETTKDRLQRELKLLKGEISNETAATKDLREFQEKLKEEALNSSIEKDKKRIEELKATGLEEDRIAADILQKKLDNADTLRAKQKEAASSEEEEQQALLSQQIEIQKIKDKAAYDQAAAQIEYKNAVAKAEYDQAVAKIKVTLAEIKAQRAKVVAELWWNNEARSDAKSAFSAASSAISSVVIPPALVLPPPKALATGAFVEASQRGTNVIVGEDGDEEIFGMGSRGVPRRSRFAKEVADMVNSNSRSGQTVNNYYSSMFAPLNASDMRKFTRLQQPYIIQEQQRRGN